MRLLLLVRSLRLGILFTYLNQSEHMLKCRSEKKATQQIPPEEGGEGDVKNRQYKLISYAWQERNCRGSVEPP